MRNMIVRLSGKILSSLMIFLIFMYVTVLICTIPMDFTISYENGRLTATHIGSLIIKSANEKFISLLQFDLGRAGRDNQSLNYLVTDIMPNSIKLLLGGILLAIILGIAKGIIDSRRGRNTESNLKVLLTIIPISLPDILIIALLQRLAVFLNNNGIKVLRIGGGDTISHMILPIIALSILPACYIARITSMSIEDCYQQDFIKTAVGKGCSSYRILWNHVMKNAIPAIIDSFSTITAIIISNLIMVEYLFSYPGLTKSLKGFLGKSESDGIIACILLIGIIYFVLDTAFKLVKSIAVKPLREESL